jgi:hypothetical protein
MRDRRVTTIRALAVATALVLALAGCGGDDGDEDAGDGTTTTTEAAEATTTESEGEDGDSDVTSTEPSQEPSTTSTTTTEAPPEVDVQALVDGIDVTLEDLWSLSSGWVVDDEEDDGGEEDDDFDACLGPAGEVDGRAETEGRSFLNEDALYEAAATGTILYGSEEEAVALMDTASTEEFRACAQDVLLEGADSGQLDLYPDGTRYGDQWVVVAGLGEVEGTSVAIDLHFLRNGPFVSFVVYADAAGGGEEAAFVVDGIVDLLDQRQKDAVEALG